MVIGEDGHNRVFSKETIMPQIKTEPYQHRHWLAESRIPIWTSKTKRIFCECEIDDSYLQNIINMCGDRVSKAEEAQMAGGFGHEHTKDLIKTLERAEDKLDVFLNIQTRRRQLGAIVVTNTVDFGAF